MPLNRQETALLAGNVVRGICDDLRTIAGLQKTAQEALQHEVVTEVASPEKIVTHENLRRHREQGRCYHGLRFGLRSLAKAASDTLSLVKVDNRTNMNTRFVAERIGYEETVAVPLDQVVARVTAGEVIVLRG